MAPAKKRRAPRPISRAEFMRLKRGLEECAEQVEKLKREIDMNIRRIGALQAEVDHLRARKD